MNHVTRIYRSNNNNLVLSGQQLDESDSPWLQYVLLRAVSKFQSENGTYPGFYEDNVELDIGKLKVIRVDTRIAFTVINQELCFNENIFNIFQTGLFLSCSPRTRLPK